MEACDIRSRSMARDIHKFNLVGAWGSKLRTVAGYRCERCDVLYVTMNLTADLSGRIFAMDPDGREIELSEMEAGTCHASE
jgi:hypothetical protein